MSRAPWVRVSLDAVEKFGADAAVVLGVMDFRCTLTGEWTATVADLTDETGLTDHRVRAALRVLRDTGAVDARRADRFHPTLTWSVSPGHAVNGDSHVTRHGDSTSSETGDSHVTTSLEEVEEETPALRAVGSKPEHPRSEVLALCNQLADRIEANGSKRPTITQGWLTSCRLLLDRDRRSADQVARAIDWCQSDDFWRANVLSMPTLRKQYDRLRLAAQRSGVTAPGAAPVLPPRPRGELYG